MRQMGWTLTEYEQTPASLVEEIWTFLCTEAKAQELEMERQRHG